jgi:hypothetical protein
MSFGLYKDSKLSDVPEGYLKYLIQDYTQFPEGIAAYRILNRICVTKTLKCVDPEPFKLIEKESIPRIDRPENVNTALYGYFIELMVKYALGVRTFPKVAKYLTKSGDKRSDHVYNSHIKIMKKPTDFVNLATCYVICPEDESNKLYVYVLRNENVYENFMKEVARTLPQTNDSDQLTCTVSVGVVSGEIDLIINRKFQMIVDIKCKYYDPVETYRRQLVTYAALHRLRFGPKIHKCQIWNFMTGKLFEMDVTDLTHSRAVLIVRHLGKDHPQHLALFDTKTVDVSPSVIPDEDCRPVPHKINIVQDAPEAKNGFIHVSTEEKSPQGAVVSIIETAIKATVPVVSGLFSRFKKLLYPS